MVRPGLLLCLMFIGLAVASLAVGSLGAQPAAASGDDIEVVREERDVRFPHGFDFDLTVESTSQITEIRLFFRPLGSPSWNYAYPRFEPGKRVTANLEVHTSGDSYLPPGARLEYYYEIRDAAGNVLETLPAKLDFIDDRFDWQQVRIGPLILNYHDLPSSRVAEIKKQTAHSLAELTALLELDTADPVQGVIYNKRSEARDVFPFQSETITEAGVFQGFAFPPHGVFVGVGLDPRLIVHETAHLQFRQSLGPRAVDLPAWLDEGLASYAEPGSISYGSRGLKDRGLSLRAMSKVSGTPSQIGLFYVKSESVVGFLIDHWGTAAFHKFLEQLRQGRQVDEGLMEVYGVDTDGLEAHWASEASGPEAPTLSVPSRPSPFLYLDIWVFGGLVLTVFFIVGARAAYRRLNRKETSAEDWDVDWTEGLSPPSDWEGRPQR